VTNGPSVRPALALLVIVASTALVVLVRIIQAKERLISTHEEAAIAALKAISSAQVSFASRCGDGRFATNLVDLGDAPPGDRRFLPAQLSSAIVPGVDGYRLRLHAVADFDSADRCNGYPLSDRFYASAEPEVMGETGRRAFAVGEDGVVWAQTGPTPPARPFEAPARPIAVD
jgi:hypothetical protein